MFFSSSCPCCGRPGSGPCPACESALGRAPALALPPGVDAITALGDYDEIGRAIVHAVKFRNDRATATWAARRLAVPLAHALADEPAQRWALTWAPTSAARRRARGFDQAERLARLVGRRLGVRPRGLLLRGAGVHQTGRSADERWAGPRFAPRRRGLPSLVVVVDDVVTTGATAAAAARALRVGGAEHVWFMSIARTVFKTRTLRAEVSAHAHDR